MILDPGQPGEKNTPNVIRFKAFLADEVPELAWQEFVKAAIRWRLLQYCKMPR